MSAHGFLNINKPIGMTSFAVVARVRRLVGEKRVGHGGTLDPDASGVLPVGIGQATRTFEYLEGTTKVYRAAVLLGIATDTYDASGAVTATADPSGVTREQVETALAPFRGHILQRPPLFSALKREGERLYEIARRGETVEVPPRPVHILRLDVTTWEPPRLGLEIECGRGTYIRSLAHDLGQALGCGAHLTGLVRTRDAAFSLNDAITLEELSAAAEQGTWQRHLLPLDTVLQEQRALKLSDSDAKLLRDGRALRLDGSGDAHEGELARAYAANGAFFAVARYDAGQRLWRPEKVFPQE